MFFINIAANDHRVHDRENFSCGKNIPVRLSIILEEASYVGRAFDERRRHTCRVQRVNFPSVKHLRQRLRGRNWLEVNLRRQREVQFFRTFGLFFAAIEILDARYRNFVLVAKDSADPYAGRHLIFGRSDAFSNQVLGLADSAVAIDENAGMSEESRWEDRDGDELRFIG